MYVDNRLGGSVFSTRDPLPQTPPRVPNSRHPSQPLANAVARGGAFPQCKDAFPRTTPPSNTALHPNALPPVDAAARSCTASSPTPLGPPLPMRPRFPLPMAPGLPPLTRPRSEGVLDSPEQGEVPDKVRRPLGHCRRCIGWGKRRNW